MRSDRASGPDPEQGPEPVPAEGPTEGSADGLPEELAAFPRLDAEGMIVGAEQDGQAPAPLSGPSPLLPGLVAIAGVVLTVLAVLATVRTVPAAGQARPMLVPVLVAGLALGGYSMTRLLQLLLLATSRARRRAAGADLPPVRWQLLDDHSLHAVWVIGVGASIGLMGLLGVWSLLDGHPSGLEPGWPLLLVGGGAALMAHLARQRASRAWQEAGEVE